MNTGHDDIKDARGAIIPLRPYRRVVSLVPSLTETVFGLGRGDCLIGRTIYCTEPREKVGQISSYGGTKNPDLDGILAAAPDLVLACVEENKPEHLATLADAGVPVFAVMPRSLDDVAGLLRDFGRLLAARDATGRALSDLAAARLAAGQYRQTASPEALRAVTLIWKNPWMAAGSGNHIDAMMQELGLVNVVSQRDGYFEVALENLVQENLDLVLLPDEPFPFTHHDSWSMAAADVVASRQRAVLLDGKMLSWYGTRTARSLRALVRLAEKWTLSR